MKKANKDTKPINPSTRRKQLFFNIRYHYPLLLKIGSILLLFGLPLLVSILLEGLYNFALTSNASYFINGSFTEEGLRLFKTNTLIFSFIKGACYLLLFVSFAGIFKVLRVLCYGDPVFFKKDFIKGLKQNAKYFVLLGLLVGIIRICLTLIALGNLNVYISALLYGLILIIFVPLIFSCSIYITLYNSGVSKMFTHSGYVLLKKYPYYLLILLFLAPVIPVYLISSFAIKIAVVVAVMFIYIPLFLLIWYEIGLYTMDREINHTYYPDSENKGLYD